MTDKDDSWIDEVYACVERNDPDAAVDVLFRGIDRLLRAGEFSKCDDLLMSLDLERLDSNLLVALDSITRRAADKLPRWTKEKP